MSRGHERRRLIANREERSTAHRQITTGGRDFGNDAAGRDALPARVSPRKQYTAATLPRKQRGVRREQRTTVVDTVIQYSSRFKIYVPSIPRVSSQPLTNDAIVMASSPLLPYDFDPRTTSRSESDGRISIVANFKARGLCPSTV